MPSGSFIGHHTAAELWGAAVPATGPPTSPCLPPVEATVRQGIRFHYRKDPAQTTHRKSLPVSTPEQTFLDLAAVGVGLVDLVVADGMIKAGHTSPERLIDAAVQWSGKGCRVAAGRLPGTAERIVKGDLVRLLLVLAGLPEPRVNLIMRGRDGGWRRRYDMAYEHLRLIIEYDGRKHAEDARQWLTDIFRREELDQMRWRLVIVTSEASISTLCEHWSASGMRCWSAERLESDGPSSRNGACTSRPTDTRAVSRRLASIRARLYTRVSHLKTADGYSDLGRAHAGAVSDRMSMRQPVSRAASRAFWPSRPIASDS